MKAIIQTKKNQKHKDFLQKKTKLMNEDQNNGEINWTYVSTVSASVGELLRVMLIFIV